MCKRGQLTYNPMKNFKVKVHGGLWIPQFTDDVAFKIVGSEFQKT